MDRRTFLRAGAALACGAAWLPLAHLPWAPDPDLVDAMVERHLRAWSLPDGPVDELRQMRVINPEYDLMSRTFTVLALADVALLGGPRAERCRGAIDRILEDTLHQQSEHGQLHWLMAYARAGRFRGPGGRSLFVDGEIAMMLGARQLLGDAQRWREPFFAAVERVERQLEDSPHLIAESYPNECWLFCNGVALVALRMADALDGRRRDLPSRWVASARERLVDPTTGLFVSSCTWDGRPGDGPEGSSIFFTTACLRLVAPDLAAEQYALAYDQLGRSLLGFGWAREWPASWRGPQDVDSGPVVPGFDASPSASGLAILAARSFGDEAYWSALVSSVNLAGIPSDRDGERRLLAANLVGEAVILAGHVHGPLWAEISRRRSS